jgi:hypothetical protein
VYLLQAGAPPEGPPPAEPEAEAPATTGAGSDPVPDAAPPEDGAAAALPRGYNPVELIDKGSAPGQVFLSEPRHPEWAPAVESVIGGAMRADVQRLVPEARGLGMSCRTLSCLVQVDAPAGSMAAAMQVAKLVTLGPVTVDLPPTKEGRGQFLFFTEPRMADPNVFTGWYRTTRKRTLAQIKEGKRPNPLPVPVDQLPAE